MRYPNIHFLALLACLILDCMTALVRVLSLFAKVSEPLPLIYVKEVIFFSIHGTGHRIICCHNRSWPLWTLLAVLWQMCHVWITAWNVTGSVLVTGIPRYLKRKSTIFHVFRGVNSFSIMPGTPSVRRRCSDPTK